MTDISKTHRFVKDENGKTRLIPIKRRYDVSTELQRRASAKRPKLATRAKALSVKKVDHVPT